MKRIVKIIAAIAAVLTIAFFLLSVPDADPQEMRTKYMTAASAYSEGTFPIHYRDEGNPQGVPIILIHGSNSSLQTWEPMIANMPKDTFRLVSLDLPGHGLTGPHPGDDYSAGEMIAAISSVMDELGIEKAVLAGNSMGGWVSWRMALAAPPRVLGLVLVDASGVAPKEKPEIYLAARLLQNPLMRLAAIKITPKSIVRSSLEGTVYDKEFITDEMITRYWEMARFPGNRRANAVRAKTNREPEYAARLGEIKVPSLIIWGAADAVTPLDMGETFKAAIPGAQLTVYENTGHLPMEERPVRFAHDLAAFVQKIVNP